MSTILVIVRLALLVALFVSFRRLEIRGRGVVVVLAVLGIALLDGVFYPTTEDGKLTSIFHPEVLGQSFRLTQLVVPLALASRLSVWGWPRRIDASAPLWLAFFAWIAVSTVVGLLEGHPAAVVFRQAAIIVNVGGGLALAASVPARDYVTGATMTRFLQGAAAVATTLFFTDTFGPLLTTTVIPDLPIVRLGRLGADAATLFSSLGVLGFVLGVCRPRAMGNRAAILVPSALLILSHLASPQRALRLGLYIALLLLVLVFCTPTARRRARVSGRQFVVVLGSVLAVSAALVFVSAVASAVQPPEPVTYSSEPAQNGGIAPRTRLGSIQSRYNQWDTAAGAISESPVLGHGLGAQISHYEVGKHENVISDITHNIVVDLLVRTGAVGLLLAAAALLVVWWQAIGTWRRHVDDRIAALAIAAVTLSAGLLAKGMVESIFEKHRLALLLGILLGFAVSATLSRERMQPAGDIDSPGEYRRALVGPPRG